MSDDNIIYVKFGTKAEPANPTSLEQRIDNTLTPDLPDEFIADLWQSVTGKLYFADITGSRLLVTDFRDRIKLHWDEQIAPYLCDAFDDCKCVSLNTNYGADDHLNGSFMPLVVLDGESDFKPVSMGGLFALANLPAFRSDFVYDSEALVADLWDQLDNYLTDGLKSGFVKSAYNTLANIYDGDFTISAEWDFPVRSVN